MQEGGSQTVTMSLNTVLLNGGEVWEQGNQEGVLMPLLLLAEPVAEIPAEAVAISPPPAAHGNHWAGSAGCERHAKHTKTIFCLLCFWTTHLRSSAGSFAIICGV